MEKKKKKNFYVIKKDLGNPLWFVEFHIFIEAAVTGPLDNFTSLVHFMIVLNKSSWFLQVFWVFQFLDDAIKGK